MMCACKFICRIRPFYAGLLPFTHSHTVNFFDTTDDRRLHDYKPNDGWDRLYIMFSRDKYGSLSKEVISIMQITTTSVIGGLFVGGLRRSKNAAADFVERNDATQFISIWEAKRKMQDYVFVKFLQGGLRWAIKFGFFGFCFSSFITLVGTYRGATKVRDYTFAGFVSGALATTFRGPKGMLGGGMLGGFLTTITGAVTIALLKMSNKTMDDVRQWQYNMKKYRDDAIQKQMSHFSVYKSQVGPHLRDYEERTGLKIPPEELKMVYIAVPEGEYVKRVAEMQAAEDKRLQAAENKRLQAENKSDKKNEDTESKNTAPTV